MKSLPKNLLFAVALAVVLISMALSLAKADQGADFPEFYAAAKIVRLGQGRQLYSASLQHEFQARFTGRVGTYFNHPPFEALLFLPLAETSVAGAYQLWGLINIVLLGWTVRVLVGDVFPHLDWRPVLLASLVFPPILLNFVQGQDSILLLSCEILAFAGLKRGRPAIAGACLGCGLFKFHIVLPIVAVIFLGTRKRVTFLKGFAWVAALLGCVSTLVSGWDWPANYVRFLMQLPSFPLSGIHPEAMANLRGLARFLPISESARIGVLVSLSLALLFLVIRSWRRHGDNYPMELLFANAVVASLLVSYHLSPHDLSLLLLPLALVLGHIRTTNGSRRIRRAFLVIVPILFLPPLHWLMIKDGIYMLMTIPVLAFFFLIQAEIEDGARRRSEALAGT